MFETRPNVLLTSIAEALCNKIRSRTARVGVIGLGYVGLPLAVEKAKVGFTVAGFDTNEDRARRINSGINYISDVKDAELKEMVELGRLRATTDMSGLAEMDVIVICVPTPLTVTRDPDISYMVTATEAIAAHLRRGQLVTLESTTFPGTTQEIILPRLVKGGLVVGEDFFLVHSPERVDPGNKRFTTNNISKVVGGVTPSCLEVALTFYEQTIQNVVPVSSPAVAEMTKVFENTYRAVNIALVNELMLICDRMNLDVWEVVDAAGTKPFGIQTFYPGPGVGGHCIPIDPFYLTWKAREYDLHTRFIELAGETNAHMPYYVVEKVIRALNRQRKALKGARILLMGVAYKKNLDDARESPALKVAQLLSEHKAEIVYHDPYIPEVHPHEKFTLTLRSMPLDAGLVRSADCVVILTDHDCIDYQWLVTESPLIVDTRNVTKNVTRDREKILKI